VRVPSATRLRSRVPRKWHARFCSRGGGSDPLVDCNRMGGTASGAYVIDSGEYLWRFPRPPLSFKR
jgi:hypothetical protein